MIVGSVVLITTNALIFGFVNWLPTFFVKQGLSMTQSLGYTLVIISGSLVGCAIGAFLRRPARPQARPSSAPRSGASSSARSIPSCSDPTCLLAVGFLLIVGIYVLTALLYGVYTSELFPTEVRLRANGICNMFGRGATIVTPLLVVALFTTYSLSGVLALMIGLLVIQIVVVAGWGIEPAKRRLEELEGEEARARA